jgi:hypothetical protein
MHTMLELCDAREKLYPKGGDDDGEGKSTARMGISIETKSERSISVLSCRETEKTVK